MYLVRGGELGRVAGEVSQEMGATGLDSSQCVVIVGGGIAAARAGAQLRRQGFTGRITLVSEEHVPPYDRPPLSKAVLLRERDETWLDVDYRELQIELRLGTAALGLDTDRRVVHTEGGEIGYDALIIATGAVPITLPGDGKQHVLRSDSDALRLRARLAPEARIAIVGASWIGAEIATAALRLGCRVTCVEAGPAPLAQALGEDVGRRTTPWWAEVDLRTEAKTATVEPDGLRMTDGERIPADTVVTGIGVRPAIGWLAGSGLELDGGVLVDGSLRTNVPGVVAIGDVAAYRSVRFQDRIRVEHWTNAAESPAVAVAALLGTGESPTHDPVPYFWSDQFGRKVQYFGHHRAADRLVWRDPAQAGGWAAAWLDDQDRLTGFVGVRRAKDAVQAGTLIEQGAPVDPDALADPDTPVRQSAR